MFKSFYKVMFALVIIASFASNHVEADLIAIPGGTLSSGITYSVTSLAGSLSTPNGAGDIQTSVDGGSFEIDFSAPVDIEIFNSLQNQGNNFDGQAAPPNWTITTDAGVWSYTSGTSYDLTSGAGGQNVVGGLGGNNLTVGNARIFTPSAPGIASSGAPLSSTDWGTFAIQGISNLTWTYPNDTNFEGFRIDAVAAAVAVADETAVPEPSSLGLLGFVCLLGLARRRRV